jgi:hypothetical protein
VPVAAPAAPAIGNVTPPPGVGVLEEQPTMDADAAASNPSTTLADNEDLISFSFVSSAPGSRQ